MPGSVALDTNVVVAHFRHPGLLGDKMRGHELHVPVTVVA